ncbi:enoyl-CoA hydratase/isomerase family protein [Stieleria sp. TO1_6]|uniref:enoyl-CoA hydratase/isomerase family protein n=1 Tax=Stieleria tagensis TaxID=2956795 RepID=UPI00209BA78B|nr:enoyl-CoA hydratase/isomerase family protein [Stieleria tagensis]MCO8125312.1 enoyl-CoA hydratase/isomerase family protein [Stieleria tagensis]
MQTVEVKIVDRIATVMMDRPNVCNALDGQLIADLTQAFSDVHQEKRVDALVLTGKGDHFCSGVDLKTFGQVCQLEPIEAQLAWFEFWRELTELCEAILRFPKPVVAAVDGPAIGAGLALALAADLLVLSDRASLSANAAQRGLIGGLTAPLLTFRYGAAIAARMLLTGQAIDADQALGLGMCVDVVPPVQIWVAANRWAKQCGEAPQESVQATKRMLNESVGEALLSHLASGAATAATVCNTASASEGIRAFIEKRPPEWP